MTCPCLYPIVVTITDKDGDKDIYWGMPDDELDSGKFEIPKVDNITQDGKEWVAVMWEDPKGMELKSYEVNGHLVYAGCSLEKLTKKGNKMSCKEKELYIVLHPKEEWESYHMRYLLA